jgi:hypothetical protein
MPLRPVPLFVIRLVVPAAISPRSVVPVSAPPPDPAQAEQEEEEQEDAEEAGKDAMPGVDDPFASVRHHVVAQADAVGGKGHDNQRERGDCPGDPHPPVIYLVSIVMGLSFRQGQSRK